MAKADSVKQMMALCEECTSTPIDQLVTNLAWGSINFEGARADLERMFAIFSHFKLLPIDLLPEQTLASIHNYARDSVKPLLDRLKQFTIEVGSPTGERTTLINEIQAAADSFYITSQQWIPYLAYQKGDVQRNIDNLTTAVSQATTALDEAKRDIERKKAELDGIISAARDAAASVGVAHFTADFHSEGDKLRDESSLWLKSTVVFAATTVIAAVLMLFVDMPADAKQAYLVQLFTTKFVVLGVLFAATIWCGRLYKASKHQASMNYHRSNALKTFQAFVKATDDEGTRNAVLLETTRSIFAITPTGYLDVAEPSGEGATKVIEVMKNLTQTK